MAALKRSTGDRWNIIGPGGQAGKGYVGYRPIPKRIDIVGPRVAGMNYIGMAESQLCILEEQMRLFGQNIGSRTIRLPNGDIIEAWKNAGMAGVKITTSGATRRQAASASCFCACHVATGFIQNSDHGCPDMTGGTPGETWPPTYNVLVCKTETMYVMILNALPMGFTAFHDQQKVMVIFKPDPGSPYVPNIKQGCHMVACRISNITENHNKFTS